MVLSSIEKMLLIFPFFINFCYCIRNLFLVLCCDDDSKGRIEKKKKLYGGQMCQSTYNEFPEQEIIVLSTRIFACFYINSSDPVVSE